MIKNKLDMTRLIALGLLALAFFSPVHAGLYKCTDKNGRTYYQDKPCQDLIATRLPSWMSSLSGRQEESAFLWKAAGEKGTVYLLGAPHYGIQSFYPLPQMVMDAFGNSQVVGVETDLWNIGEKERESALKNRGRYEGKDSLDSHIKQVTWEKAKEMGKKLGYNEEEMRMNKPWRAALLLSMASLKEAGYTADLSVAQTFLKESQGRKPIVRLGDEVPEQIKQLEDLSDREQEQLLLQTLAELGRVPEVYKNISEAWKKGDVESMDQIVRQNYDSGEISAKLAKIFLEDGNENIVNQIVAQLKSTGGEDKTLFAVVGANRMGGERGILKLLQDRKFTVTQP